MTVRSVHPNVSEIRGYCAIEKSGKCFHEEQECHRRDPNDQQDVANLYRCLQISLAATRTVWVSAYAFHLGKRDRTFSAGLRRQHNREVKRAPSSQQLQRFRNSALIFSREIIPDR